MQSTSIFDRDPMFPHFELDERFPCIISRLPGAHGGFECLSASRVRKDVYRIKSQPLGHSLAYGDLVRTQKRTWPLPEIQKVIGKSGYESIMISGLQPNRKGRKIFDKLSKLAYCEAWATDIFTISAPKKNWRAIENILKGTNVARLPSLSEAEVGKENELINSHAQPEPR